MTLKLILSILIGYLLGSIPFALIIGKVFFKKDIRQHGSKNLGGGNAGRVLGKKAGVAVMIMDILKVALTIFIALRLTANEDIAIISGLAAAIGHCYPVFARFKGGKAVATMYGFLFGMAVCTPTYNLLIFILPLVVFLIVLYIGKIISVSSMISAIFITVFAFITMENKLMGIALTIFTVLMIYRHRSNIKKLFKGQENKISWM